MVSCKLAQYGAYLSAFFYDNISTGSLLIKFSDLYHTISTGFFLRVFPFGISIQSPEKAIFWAGYFDYFYAILGKSFGTGREKDFHIRFRAMNGRMC